MMGQLIKISNRSISKWEKSIHISLNVSNCSCFKTPTNPRQSCEQIKTQENGGKSPREGVELPDDLVEEIVHHLRWVKSLLRFKSISKGWKSMIESGHLAEKHLRLRQKRDGAEELKVTFKWSEQRCFRMEFISKNDGFSEADKVEPEEYIRVAGSCNGLFCIYDLVYVYLTNPMTKVMRALVPPQGFKLSVGFGRDIVRGTCKVVVLYSPDDRVETFVFDLGTSEWRRTAGPMPLGLTLISPERNPAFVKGSLFWLLTSEILVMDLHTEKFRTVSQLLASESSPAPIYIWSFEDRLCVSDFSYVWFLVQDKVSER
ncbi:unnamed protein product [Arabis nemorensis]|uniref:F-box domain-containing protein n=1 Tax=Arabis nemorensis TaxID=586526 RepID=A0A565CRR3_9BRAS|nr:unnamed protein product [Arabis nemorensis]